MGRELFKKCKNCGSIFELRKIEDNYHICESCGYYWPLTYQKRLDLIIDHNSFNETNHFTGFYNPINFPDYIEKHKNIVNETKLTEAIVTGEAKISGLSVMLGVMDTRYMMGSMGIVVGEKVTRLFEDATKRKLPVFIFVASGGARMQDGIFALMQMGKTAAAVMNFNKTGGLYISILTNPTTGGVSASFAFLGDIILAEPRALIGFAGKRVIEQTIKEQIPKDFQTAEYLFEHGYIDKIVARSEMKNTLSKLLKLHSL